MIQRMICDDVRSDTQLFKRGLCCLFCCCWKFILMEILDVESVHYHGLVLSFVGTPWLLLINTADVA